MTDAFRELLSSRHFVDREVGALLIWVPTERPELVDLVAKIEARHPGSRFVVQESGRAVAVRVTAREEDLAVLEELYINSTA